MHKIQSVTQEDNNTTIKIGNHITATWDNDAFNENGEMFVDYDEKIMTAGEAQEVVDHFFGDLVSYMERKNKIDISQAKLEKTQ